ncbi:hypothetical protein B14911_25880 [Bacillus sp. NRRL B-14911]|nr:hypothetical protein B14911_25880 [Bacillus sp. NRRL B-14911]
MIHLHIMLCFICNVRAKDVKREMASPVQDFDFAIERGFYT